MPEILGLNDLLGGSEDDTLTLDNLYKQRIQQYNIKGPSTPTVIPREKITPLGGKKLLSEVTERFGKPLHQAGVNILKGAENLRNKLPAPLKAPVYLAELAGGAFNAFGPGSFEFADRIINPEKYGTTTGGTAGGAIQTMAKNAEEFPAQMAENIREAHRSAGLPFAEYNPAAWAMENVGTPVTNLFGSRTDEQVKKDAKASIAADPSSAVQTAAMFAPVAKIAGKVSMGFPEGLKPAKARFATPAGKELVSDLMSVDETHARMAGTAIEEAHTAGLARANKKVGEAIGEGLQSDSPAPEVAKQVDGIRNVLNQAWERAKQAGIPIGQVKNYFPRILRREVREQLWSGIDQIESALKKDGSFSDAAVARALKKTNILTEEALYHLTRDGKANGLVDALKQMRMAFADKLVAESPFTKPRTLELPSSFYETDARIVIPEYLNSLYKQIAWTEKWGPNAAGLRSKIAKIGEISKTESDLGRTLVERWAGTEKRLSPKLDKAASIWSKVQVGTKIFAGTAALKQLTQPAISFMFKSGVWDSMKGAAQSLTKEGRVRARQSGALEQSMMFQMIGDLPEGNVGDVYRVIERNHPFTVFNRGLQYMSALTAEQSINRWYRQAQNTGKIGDIARNHLDQFGIDPTKPLTKETLQEKMYRFATDSQMQRNILNDPVFFNDPHYRPFVLFKRFGYRQAAWMAENLERDVFQNKNPLPLLRLMSLGIVGGEFAQWADNRVREWATGVPQYREEDLFTLRRAINDLASIGAMGVISDIAGSRIEKLGGAVSRAIMPVMLADVDRMADAYTQVMQNYKQTGSMADAIAENASKLTGPLGSIPSGLASRTQTDTQKRNESDARKMRKRDDILDMIVAGDSKEATRQLELWNKNNGDNQIQPFDMTTKDLLTHANGREVGIIKDLIENGQVEQARERHKAWNIMYPKYQIESFDTLLAKTRRSKIQRDRDRRREVIRYGTAIQ